MVALYSPPRRVHFCCFTLRFPFSGIEGCTFLLRLSPFYNHPVARTLLTRLRAQGRKSPRSLRVISLHAAFTATVRMVHRVHGHATHRGTLAVPPRATRFPVSHVFMIQVAKLADRGHAIHAEFSHFAG